MMESNFSIVSPKKVDLNSFLIGENHLLIKCAELLIKENHNIIGIVSNYPTARDWASSYKIPLFKTIQDAELIFETEPVDYLFSIVNGTFIPKSLLTKVRSKSINFHNSFLPHYAGLNAPSWAILNNESFHGVTWHEMTEVVDEGVILKQAQFPVSSDETGLSLNHKCYQLAYDLFEQLIKDLADNNLKPIAKNKNKGSYHGLSDKPLHNGLVSWELPGEEIEKLFRALHLGVFDNTLSILKIQINKVPYILADLKLCSKSSDCLPGILVEINTDFWRISTASKDIIVYKIYTIDGKECPLSDLIQLHQISAGYSLKYPSNYDLNAFQRASMELGKKEAYWRDQLISFAPAELPFTNQFLVEDTVNSYELLHRFTCSEELLFQINCSGYKIDEALAAVWLIYLYRIGKKNNLGVALNYPELTQFIKSNPLNQFFSFSIPFRTYLDEELNFNQTVALISDKLQQIKEKHTFLKDIFYRFQNLADITPFTPIGLIIEDEFIEPTELDMDCLIIIKISLSTHSVDWYIRSSVLQDTVLTDVIRNSTKHYEILINSLLKNKEKPITEFELISATEKKLLFQTWNDTSIDFQSEKNLGLLLDKTFEKHSEQIALDLERTFINYTELRDRVNILVNYFIELKIAPQDVIVVYMSSSLEWIITVLAILKYGAIYLPVEYNIPYNRLKLIVNDSKAKFILTTPYSKEKLTQLAIANIIDVEEVLKTNYLNIGSPTIPFVSEQAIAYLLYTSGTTGLPKGVVITHKSLINLILEQSRKLPLDKDSRVLQFAHIGFDASIWEVFATLYVGSTLCISPEKTLLLGIKLAETINTFRITFVTLPPSILQTINPTDVYTLKTVVTAGESCSRELADKWLEYVDMINAYGPTETTVCATMGQINKTGYINIGKPIANTQVYVLDKKRIPVPIGVTGELYIAGCPLALGYLNQEDLTHQYFIDNPLYPSESKKIYRTRDLVRWLPDGTLEYMGRIANQIKLNSFRIEPEAIETEILHHPDITHCVVSLQKNKQAKEVLVAYYMCIKPIDLQQLRQSLREHLPHYMIPIFFIAMDSLPLTTNGKIDRKCLPAPELKSNLNISNYIPPSNDIERKLCKIWTDLLGVEPIGIHDDFFYLEGNSLLLSHFSIIVREVFDFEINLSSFLKNPTIAFISSSILKRREETHDITYNKRFFSDLLLIGDLHPVKTLTIQKPIKDILLTGATGFLGVHLLKELYCSNDNIRIFCLVRANSNEEARNTLQNTINKYGFDIILDERISVLSGDISFPFLGLKKECYNELALNLDEIYHSGAQVNHLYTYEMLRGPNVNGTIELLKLAGLHKNKKIHYISSLSAVVHFKDEKGYIIENFITPDNLTPPNNGYNQTKWVSEKLLAEASQRGFSINIYRSGWILGNNLKLSPHKNHFISLVQGCLQMNCAPNWDVEFNFLPVDFLSRMIVKISSNNQFQNKVFNFSSKQTISWTNIIQYLNDRGNNIKILDKKAWIQALNNTSEKNSLFNLILLYKDPEHCVEQNFNESNYSYDYNVQMVLDFYNECYPDINQEQLAGFLYFLNQ